MNYYDILRELYVPQFGSIWKAPNSIWSSGFAQNAERSGIHPSIVEVVLPDAVTARIIPGTSKDYRRGKCVFVVKLGNSSQTSHFLIDLSMPIEVEELKKLDRGWNGIDDLDEDQKVRFHSQISYCRDSQ